MAQLPSVFFPEPMQHIEIIAPLQSAYYAIKNIAQEGIVELQDINSGVNTVRKRYTETYMECEEAERSLRYIEQHLKAYNKLPSSPTVSEVKDNIQRYDSMNRQEVFAAIQEADAQLHEKVNIYQQLERQAHQRKMRLEAVKFYRPIMDQETSFRERRDSTASSIELGLLSTTASSIILSVTGFCPSYQLRRLITTACRATRRNIAYQTGAVIEGMSPYTFFVSSPDMCNLIEKICESFGPDVFEFPSDTEKLVAIQSELIAEIAQMAQLDTQTVQINQRFLDELASKFWDWRVFASREKQIWMTMDFGDFSRDESSVVYSGWCPTRFAVSLPLLLESATNESGSAVSIQLHSISAEEILKNRPDNGGHGESEGEGYLVPPTFIETNSFSYAFQLLNDAYGIPNYDELNGGAFYAMYPFLFAIMFGDMGHALFYLMISLAVFALEPIMRRRGRVPEMFQMAFQLKWLLIFASLCSFYCGFMYNDTFGLPMHLFAIGWTKDENRSTDSMEFWKRKDSKQVYPFGIDPTWINKDNELIFLNSFKMKLSVVMGMTQMVVGMILQLINHLHRRDWVKLLLCWVPEMLYLIPFFGYLVVIILKKWLIDFAADKDHIFTDETRSNGVSLIQVMISMILNIHDSIPELALYPKQWDIQFIIVIIFIASIPMLLLFKPIYDCVKQHSNPDFSVLEIFVMNLIHVIEFCLSALSHIASYLRLWALSLAHSQLSHVLWDELFLLTMNMNPKINFVLVFVSFAGFAAMTVAILLGMEAFSALLHAIRLMWVEFSSKFYEGMGNEFNPVALKKSLLSAGVYDE